MYKSFTSLKTSAVALIAAVSLIATSSAMAGKVKPGKPGMGNIAEIAITVNGATGEFSTLLAAATCDYFGGAVLAILTGKDRVTLFAPTDDAFGDIGLDSTSVCPAFAGDPGALLNILAYHVTDGRRFSNSVFNRQGNAKDIEMLLDSGYITTEGGMIYGAGNEDPINVVEGFFDINASNGVIHVIDTVLLP